MIKEYRFDDLDNPYDGFKRSELGNRLARMQRIVKGLNIPVLIIVDGWESSGKGYVIKDLARELDPRSSSIQLFENPTDEEKARPFLWRFWRKIPKKGDIAIFDRSFYFNVKNNIGIKKDELERDIEDISSIERQLFDDHTIIIKFFLHQKKETQRKRIEELQKDRNRHFFVTESDLNQNKYYDDYLEHFDKILEMSNFDFSPWQIVPTESLKSASKYALGMSLDLIQRGIDIFLARKNQKLENKRNPIMVNPILEGLDMSHSVDEGVYDQEVKDLQKKAQEIAYQLFIQRTPTVIAFEGMDAAGKGGAIARLTRLMDPRGFAVIPVSAPDKTENSYHYLWRFYRDFPPKGRIAIFDRSWYGRVLVERVEGFASVDEWERAYDEINQMEKHLCNFGTLVLKFFICIDNQEQLLRFKEREREADKLYKITEEDWRNREKWDEYIPAMNEMLSRTNTDYAPWIVVEGNDKKYARLKVLKEFIKYGEKVLK